MIAAMPSKLVHMHDTEQCGQVIDRWAFIQRYIAIVYTVLCILIFWNNGALANHAYNVTVQIDSIDHKLTAHCFDAYVVGCSRPDYFAVIRFEIPGSVEVTCEPTPEVTNRDHVTGPIMACDKVEVPGPFTMIVDILDSDDSKVPPEDVDQADLQPGPGKSARFPVNAISGPGPTTVPISGEDTDVVLTVTIDRKPSMIVSVSATPPIFDPSLGETTTLDILLDHPSQMRLTIDGPGGSQPLAVGFASSVRTYDLVWDGRDRGANVPPGDYTATVTDVLGAPSRNTSIRVRNRPPGDLDIRELLPVTPWSPRAGPLDVEYVSSSAANIGLRVRGGNCTTGTGPLLRTVAPSRRPAGVGVIQWDGKDNADAFVPAGVYCLQLFGTTMSGLTLPQPQETVEIVNPKPLAVVVRTDPVVPALLTSDPVDVVALAVDEDGRPRYAAEIRVEVAAFVLGGSGPSPLLVCFRAVSCRARLSPALGRPGLLLISASASDVNGDALTRTPIRLIDTEPQSLIAPLHRVSISMENNDPSAPTSRVRSSAETIDVVLHPGTGYDLSSRRGAEDFSREIGATLDGLLGIGSVVTPSAALRFYDRVNLWITTHPAAIGHAEDTPPGTDADLCRRIDFDPLSFAEVQGVLHRVGCRDNAQGGYYTSNTPSISWHEFHHAAYGLADEYCCDGGYFSSYPLPNLHDSAATCRLESVAPSLCVQVTNSTGRVPWWRAGFNPDIMVFNDREQPDDVRRADWVYSQCAIARC